MATVQQDCVPVDTYEPTPDDWEDWRRHLEAEERAEMCDRVGTLEAIRREDFNNARSAACRIRGIAAALGSYGYESIPVDLIRAATDIEALVSRYA